MPPKAIDKDKVGTYPALTFSGGGYFYDEVLEYRVWIHQRNGENDYYYPFESWEEAIDFSENTPLAENPIVLVLQKEYIDEPEPGKYHIIKEERITEWQVQWLKDGKRKPGILEEFIKIQTE